MTTSTFETAQEDARSLPSIQRQEDTVEDLLLVSLQRQSSKGSIRSTGTGTRDRKKKPKKTFRRAVTSSSMQAPDLAADQMLIKKRIRRAITHNNYTQPPTVPEKTANSSAPKQAPDVCLMLILGGATCKPSKDAFTGVTKKRIQANSLQVTQAIREDDLSLLQQLHSQGTRLDGCTSHGESTVHLAARLGRFDILKFLVEDAQVSLLVKDDTGRTPLHDACWSNEVNFELIHFLFDRAPELLFVLDQRGYTAFQYIPQSCWADWCNFLNSHSAFLRQKVNSSDHQKASDQLTDAQERMRALIQKASQFHLVDSGFTPAGATTA